MEQPLQPFLITVAEAAKLLSLSRNKIYEMIQFEGMPVYRFGKTAVRLKLSEVETWLARQQEGNTK